MVYSQGRIIMNDVVKDPHYKKQKWQLEITNNFRVYLKIFSLAEMTINDYTIDKEFLNGNKVNVNSVIQFEKSKRPPDSAWNDWKSFIYIETSLQELTRFHYP